jgi:hypothetical protein
LVNGLLFAPENLRRATLIPGVTLLCYKPVMIPQFRQSAGG